MTKSTEHEYAELLEELKRQESNAVGYDSDEIAAQQIEAFERYTGQAYGDEQVGRSQVHTREVFETIEWLRPDIARMFGSGGKAVEIEPWEKGSEQQAEAATDFLNLTFFEQQDGHAIVDSFFFDGALQKMGIVGVFWEEPKLYEPEEYSGLDMMQAQGLAEDPNMDVLEAEPEEGADPEMGPFRMKTQRVKMQARPYVLNIAPEDFRIHPRATSLDDASYCGHITRTTKSELKLLFPDKHEEIEEYADAGRRGVEDDERRQARFFDEDGQQGSAFPNRDEDDDVILHTEYIYHDKDDDDYDELIEVKRLDGCILSCEPVEENPYAAWSPIRIPHKLIGLSIADITKDIQRTQTVLMRSALDATYQAVAPRIIANEKSVNLADLLTVRPGGVIRVKEGTDVRTAIQPITIPDVAPAALQMMEYVSQMAEARSGVTRHSQGMDPDSLNKTATGIKLMQNAASVRKEMVARNFASGLEMMFRKFYRLLVTQTRKAAEGAQAEGKKPPAEPNLRVGKQWVTFTPSSWSEEAKVRVHVGQGTGDREAQIGQLMMLLGLQREVVANYGISNPVVTPKHLHHSIEQIGKVMGFRLMDPFFADPSTVDPQAMQQLMAPKPSPEMAKVEAQTKADQAKLAADQQADQVKGAMDMQKMEREFALKQQQMIGEFELKKWQITQEMQLKREIESQKVARGFYDKPDPVAGAKPNGNGGGSSVHMGGEPG